MQRVLPRLSRAGPFVCTRARLLSSSSSVTEGSLIEDTLKEMEADEEFQLTAKKLREVGQKRLTLEERRKRRRALDSIGVPDFMTFLSERGTQADALTRNPTTMLQINVGLYCNQACTHCHVESSPKRAETMSLETADQVLRLLGASKDVVTLDITGGAPEMNEAFRPLVTGARGLGLEVIDRCNLTVLCEPTQEDLPDFLATQGVRVVASLPCYSAKNVNQQRGNKVFERSIEGLRKLNAVGYGQPGSGLKLDLVYNPGGAFLPPSQDGLREAYAEALHSNFGIVFDELFTMTNMPIKRFADFLYKQDKLSEYMQLLVDNYNPATLDTLMCKSLVSVSYDGSLYDCDFNQALAMPLSAKSTVWDLSSLDELTSARIQTGNHCFGCTAGSGSS
uniref:Radical SAM core domain-containing protein n=1 Tax=Haptolina ericina TaxID=156174 RepID=A0A7S3AJT8_9EUKA|mmetsp:Transcript_19674/g.43917  ORF Transcript_19674/g.43917 Transcript_19674/m.43917 type:complete len:393 (+) Transcript_19674:15-1193(+)